MLMESSRAYVHELPAKSVWFGMFPLIRTVLNRDYSPKP